MADAQPPVTTLVSAESDSCLPWQNSPPEMLLVWNVGFLLAKIKSAHTEISRYDSEMAVLGK